MGSNRNEKGGCSLYFGGGIMGVLFLIMFVMKVLGIGMVANWSWWWITAPLWGPVALCILLVIAWAILMVLLSFFS